MFASSSSIRLQTLFSVASVLLLISNVNSAADDEQKLQFFENRIRPVLIKHCNECHSADSEEIKGGLRLDSREGLLTGGDSGASIEVGKPQNSLLIEALKYDGMEMPPKGKLSDEIIADFEKWISEGAVDPRVAASTSKNVKKAINLVAGRKFWAFQPVQKPAIPMVESDWPAKPIDHFLFRKMQSKGLVPGSPATPFELVRRVHFDLTGLPPSAEVVVQFAKDPSADAYEKLVDKLLDSEQFGVHWGRHWLDVARYADSNGGDFNATFHNAWKYRDYVVSAFNLDKPYDQFVREQIAGDLLPFKDDQDRSQKIIATGFLMLGAKMLSERDKAKLTMDVIDEQINTVGQALLGLTLGCARCHDHKFDPIRMKDYYALAGIFKSTRTLEGESQKYVSTWPKRKLPASEEQIAAVKKFDEDNKRIKKQVSQAKQKINQISKQIDELKKGIDAIVVDDSSARKIGFWKKSTISPQYIGTGYIHDDKSEKGEKWVEFTLPVKKTGQYEVQISYNSNSGRDPKVPVSIKHADGEKEVLVNQQKKPEIDNLFQPLGVFKFDETSPARITVSTRGTELYVIVDAVRLIELNRDGKPVSKLEPKSKNRLASLATRKKQLTSDLKSLNEKLKHLESNRPKPLPRSIAVAESKQIGDCQICIRGEHQNLGEVVPRGFIKVASSESEHNLPADQSGRLELARWIASPNHPLTARVYVNRIWSHLFGEGIVASVDNFGELGNRPTHPDLMEYLADRLTKQNWSTKKLIREILLSRTYQLSSEIQNNADQLDPENRFLSRARRKRLTAESIRDSLLAVSGNLDPTPGGSPVQGLGTLVTQNTAEQTKYKPKDSKRRSLYLPMIRAELPEILTVFDIADPDLVTGKRSITNVPGQALLLLNSPFVMEQADNLAKKMVQTTPRANDFKEQLEQTYLLMLSRPVEKGELNRGLEFLQTHWNEKEPSRGLSRYIHAIMASTEFRMLD